MNTNRVTALTRWGILATVRIVLAYASAIVVGGWQAIAVAMHSSAIQSRGLAFNSGVSPASMNSGDMPQAANVIYYNSKFTRNLKSRTPAQRVTSRRDMPTKAGQQYRDFMYKTLPPNTQQAAEGVIGSGIKTSVAFTTFTLGQWADYINFSDFSLDTAIDPTLENNEKELAYRCGTTIQRLVLAQADFARTVDASVASYDATSASQVMTKDVLTQNSGSLSGRDVEPLDGMGSFGGLIHNFFISDMLIDNSNNSFVDILKRYPEGNILLKELPGGDKEFAKVIEFAGVVWMPTNLLTTIPNFLASGKTAIRTYILGQDGVISVKLNRPDKTSIGDGDYRNLKLWRGRYSSGSGYDPAGMIGGGTSYNVVGTWGLPPDTTMRLRAFDYVPKTT